MQTKDKVRFYRRPPRSCRRNSPSTTMWPDKKPPDNALFKEIEESQKKFAERAVKWDLDNNVRREMAYNHYFAKK